MRLRYYIAQLVFVFEQNIRLGFFNKKILFLSILSALHLYGITQINWIDIDFPSDERAFSISHDTAGINYMTTDFGILFSDDGLNWSPTNIVDTYTIVEFSKNNVMYYGGSSQLCRSYDGGNTIDTLFIVDGTGIASIYTENDSLLFFGTWGSVLRSSDAGVTWDTVLITNGGEVFNSIKQTSNGELFIGSISFTMESPGGVHKSIDDGVTWELTSLSFNQITSLIIDSSDNIYAGSINGPGWAQYGIYKSSDYGLTWDWIYGENKVNSMDINEIEEIVIGCSTEELSDGGVYLSNDLGDNWEDITGNLPTRNIKRVVFSKNNKVFAIIGSEKKPFITSTIVFIKDNIFKIPTQTIETFPNPTYNNLKVHLTTGYISNIKVFDEELHLKEVIDFSTKFIQSYILNFGKYCEGIYYIVIRDSKGNEEVKKIIKLNCN